MDRFKAWLGEGLILVPTVLLLGFLLFTLAFQTSRLSNLAEFLPEDTDAFFVVNMEDFWASGSPLDEPAFKEFAGVPISELSWFEDDLAVAWIEGNPVQLAEVESKTEAEAFIQGLVADETPTTNGELLCFEAQGLCFRFVDDFLAFSNFDQSLAALDGASNLEDNKDYQNVRGRLGHLESGFAYVNLNTMGEDLLTWLSPEDFTQPLFLKSVFTLFPAWGMSIRMEAAGWYMESFTPANKELLNGAYFRPTEKYEQKFLPWTQSFAWEWGTQDLAGQLTRMQEIFSSMGTSGGMIFTSSIENSVENLFGQAETADILAVLDGETYFGWTSSEDFLLIFEIENETDRKIALELEDAFVQSYAYKNTYTASGGEIKAEVLALSESAVEYEGSTYYVITAGGEKVAAVAFTETAALVAANEDLLKDALDRKMDRQSGRNLEEVSVLLPGSNEIWILDSAFLSETNILKTRLSTLTRIMSTRKLFDDGVFTRTSLLR